LVFTLNDVQQKPFQAQTWHRGTVSAGTNEESRDVQSGLVFAARLTRPELGVLFALAYVQQIGGLAVLAAGIAATVGNHRRHAEAA
jgi:hypothetical protein